MFLHLPESSAKEQGISQGLQECRGLLLLDLSRTAVAVAAEYLSCRVGSLVDSIELLTRITYKEMSISRHSSVPRSV